METVITSKALIDTLAIPFEARTRYEIPLFSFPVKAGFPSPADDHVELSLDLNEKFISNPPSTFFIRVEGKSMVDAGIRDGDMIIVDKSIEPTDGRIVVAAINNEATVKRFRKKNGRLWLQSENPHFPDIELTGEQELEIWGVVTFTIHKAR